MAENNKTDKPQQPQQQEPFIYGVIEFFLSGIATSFEVLIRKDFGERYFTFVKFLIGLIIIGFFAFMANINLGDLTIFYSSQTAVSSRTQTDLLPNFSRYFFLAYLIAYFYLGIVEMRKAFVRSRDGTTWHSFFNGQSRLNFLNEITESLGLKRMLGQHIISNHFVQLYIEPLFLFGLGVVLVFVFPLIGAWFITGAFITFLRSQIIYGRLKAQYLDINDGQIESKFMNQAMKGESPYKTSGLTTMAIRPSGFQNGVNPFNNPNTQEVIQAVLANNPNLAKMAGTNQTQDIQSKPTQPTNRIAPFEIKKAPSINISKKTAVIVSVEDPEPSIIIS